MSDTPCPFANEACPQSKNKRGCYQDTHHESWPARNYRSDVEQSFRELPENKIELCRQVHNDLHATEPIPIKPSVEVMRHAIAESRAAQAAELGSVALEASNE